MILYPNSDFFFQDLMDLAEIKLEVKMLLKAMGSFGADVLKTVSIDYIEGIWKI
jgi:hypothetical protein